MEFKSLNDAFANNFIKSLPHLTRLNLTANEKLIIELVLSFKREGLDFYMNHSKITEYLVVGDTKTKAKSVGNIIAKLRKKGYIETVTTHNYNGKNGGSSTTITVNEPFLESQLNAVFNPTPQVAENPPKAAPILELEPIKIQLQAVTPSVSAVAETLPSKPEIKPQTNDEFLAELEAMEDEPRPILNLPCLKEFRNPEQDDAVEQEDYGYMEIETITDFKAFLYRLLRLDSMRSKRNALLHLIDNKPDYDLEKLKEAFKALVLNPIY